MRGPQRFADLQRYLAGITLKRLTVNLRTLEAKGILERERAPGRREVWYRLTAKGQGLAPVIKALAAWGLAYPLRVPLPGEAVYPEHTMGGMSFAFNQRGLRLPGPITWTVWFGAKSVFTLRFDGQAWSVEPTDVLEADVRIETTLQTWTAYWLGSQEERQRLLPAMRIRGEPSRVQEFLAITGREKQA